MHYCSLLFFNDHHPTFVPAAKTLLTLTLPPSLSIVDSDGWFLLPPGVGVLTSISICHSAFTAWSCNFNTWALINCYNSLHSSVKPVHKMLGPGWICSHCCEPTPILAEKVWLTVSVLVVYLKGIRWGCDQAHQLLSDQTWTSWRHSLCDHFHVETTKCQTKTADVNLEEKYITVLNIIIFCRIIIGTMGLNHEKQPQTKRTLRFHTNSHLSHVTLMALSHFESLNMLQRSTESSNSQLF